MTVCCVFSLESPHRGDSNEYTQHTIISMKRKSIQNYPKYNNAAMGLSGCQKRVRIDMVNEPSVFETLKFYCISE